ncbi:MAG: hypothetical protein BYD32DRAFT_230730 [Podila humilis]|nr:MAG: hypothetical protein BYD32DRAFT_230730 [Podila humilis]
MGKRGEIFLFLALLLHAFFFILSSLSINSIDCASVGQPFWRVGQPSTLASFGHNCKKYERGWVWDAQTFFFFFFAGLGENGREKSDWRDGRNCKVKE